MGSHHKIYYFFILLGSIALMLSSTTAYAQYPDITGIWTGTASSINFNCLNPADNDLVPSTDNITATFSNQVSGNFDVTVDGVEADGGTWTDTGSGFFLSPNTIEMVIFGSPGAGGTDETTINGTIVGNQITFTFNGFNTGGDECEMSGNGSITFSGGGLVVTPDVTPSSTVTEAVLFNTQIQTQVTDISRHITGAVGGGRYFWRPFIDNDQFKVEGATGLNAGDGSTIPYGVWGNYSYTDFDNDLSSIAFDGNSHSFLGGLDFAFWENTVLGVAFGYDNGDIDTTFNGGNQDIDSYMIAPYFGALLTDTLSIDFNVGYSRVEFDQFRTLPGTTTRITSSPDADRWFGALNLNGVAYYDNWILGARIGALWAKSVIDSYTESNGVVVARSRSKLGSGSIAGDVAYSYKNFEPFLNLSYQYDFELTDIAVTTGPQPSNDDDDILMRVGVRYFNNNISGNLEYSKRFERDDFDEDRIGLTLRIDF